MRAVIVPTRWERRAILRSLPGARPAGQWDLPAWQVDGMLVFEIGMGPIAAAATLPTLTAVAPREVWLLGVCGALQRDLKPGDLVLSNATWLCSLADAPPQRMPHPLPDPTIAHLRHLAHRQQRQLVIGPVLTSDRLLTTVQAKRAAAVSGALAVEMEAGPLARWANSRGVPFLHLRVVLDPLDGALPHVSDGEGELDLAALLAHPAQWPTLWRLLGYARAARRTLALSIAALARASEPLGVPADRGAEG